MMGSQLKRGFREAKPRDHYLKISAKACCLRHKGFNRRGAHLSLQVFALNDTQQIMTSKLSTNYDIKLSPMTMPIQQALVVCYSSS